MHTQIYTHINIDILQRSFGLPHQGVQVGNETKRTSEVNETHKFFNDLKTAFYN